MALLFHSRGLAWAAVVVVSMRRTDRIAVNGAGTNMPWYVLRLECSYVGSGCMTRAMGVVASASS